MEDFLKECAQAVVGGDTGHAERLASRALAEGYSVVEVIENGFVVGIREVGRLWEEGELFLPELVMGAEAMKGAMGILEPAIEGAGGEHGAAGHVVIGTIEGDIHDIGKTLVATMLSANGFEITDLGADVPVSRFIEEAEARSADCIAISALLTTTMHGQKRVVEELKSRSARERFKVIVGGAPCSEDWAEQIEADGYAGDAVAAVALVRNLVGNA